MWAAWLKRLNIEITLYRYSWQSAISFPNWVIVLGSKSNYCDGKVMTWLVSIWLDAEFQQKLGSLNRKENIAAPRRRIKFLPISRFAESLVDFSQSREPENTPSSFPSAHHLSDQETINKNPRNKVCRSKILRGERLPGLEKKKETRKCTHAPCHGVCT